MATATHVTSALPRQLPVQPNGCRSVEGFTTPSGKGLDKGKHRSHQEHHLSRYTKGELIGQGAQKRVYKAFDEELGLEVAWNEVPVAELAWTSEKERDRIFSEIRVLKQLKHKNIIALHDWWFDQRTSTICFITELFTDGTLRQYRRKHRNADLAVLKRWAWQILQGLVYLHAHNPPIIHRDLKSDNIFVNGCSGTVKIGDLGFATMRAGLSMAMSVIGTPEFMAPELYEESYNEKVDVYSFGMCLLELDTLEYPYAECKNAAQIFKKVTSGIPPAGLKKVSCDELRDFISTCICQDPNKRPESRQLLKHSFFDCIRLSTGGGMGIACKSGISLSSMAPQSRNASPRQSLTGMTSEPRPPLSPTQPAMQPAALPSPTGPPPPSRPASQIAEPTTPPNGAGAATTAARQKLPDGARGGLISAALAQPAPKRTTHESPAVADSLAQQAYSRRATHTGPAEQRERALESVTPAGADRRVGTAAAAGALVPAAGTHPAAAARPGAARRPVELPAPQPSPFLAAMRTRDREASACLASATDLDESDILFSNSHMRAPQSGEVDLSPCGPHDRRMSMAHSRSHTLSRELMEVWSGSEDSTEEGGIPCRGNGAHAEGDAEQPNVAASVASSLRPDLSMRLNMKCRRTPDDGTLSFSLSFVNHCGLRKKVGFLYNTEEDQPVQIAHEMVENLSLRVDEAAFIAEMLQKQVEEQGGQIQLQVVQEVPGSCQEAANGGCYQEGVQRAGAGNWEGGAQQGRRQSASGSSCCSMGSGSASTCGSNVRASASTPDRAGVGEGAGEPYGEEEDEEEEDEDSVPSCFF